MSVIWSSDTNLDSHPILRQLKCLNVNIKYSPEIINYMERKRRWYKRQTIPFEQWVKKDENIEWEEYFKEEGIRTVLEKDYLLQKKNIELLGDKYPFISKLFDYQKDDIIRLSLKNSAIDASEMGLGKTRKALTLILLRNVKHCLIVLPKRLIREWKNEVNKLNKFLSFEHKIRYNIIENEEDINHLSKINIISYYTLCQKTLRLNKNKVIADKLRRRFKFIIADEAHSFSNSTTIRTRNMKKLKAKYWLFLTGTPIQNVVANFWSLCDLIYGGNTALFPYTTSKFRKQFVTVEWVTRQYDDTLARGRTSQRLPKIKNLDEFNNMTKYMILRRLKEEPTVKKDVKIVKPILNVREFTADPEHWRVYKKYLDEFAELFRKYLHPELYEHERVKASVVLAQMQNLQFVSTMPQHTKFNKFVDEYRYKFDFTVIQKELLHIIKENYKTEKIILISQRPDFCSFLNVELEKLGIESGVFTGSITIEKRNILLDKFDQNTLRILLCSINVFKEGINLPSGSLVIIVDLDWTFQKLTQAYSRVLRPETKESPTIHILYYKGFIDDYLWQHIRAKKSAVLSSIDRRTDTEEVEWVHWKDMTYKMLKELGYNLD